MMPVAVLRRLLPGEAGANSPARQAQSFVERLRLAHTCIDMKPFWHAAQAAIADCRLCRGNSKTAPVHRAQRTRRIQKDFMALCRQGRYRRALRLLDRNPLLDLRVPENLQRVRDLHPPATAPVVAPDLAGLPDAPMLSADAVVAKLRAMDSFSAAGPDLLSARMLKLVLDDAPGSLEARFCVR
jgi:hypothetical protein